MTFAPDGLLVLTGLAGVATLNLQGCNALTDAGLAALADMTSLTAVNLQDCRQVWGTLEPGKAASAFPAWKLDMQMTAYTVP